MKVRFLMVAKAEFDDAIEYYETQQEGLGNRFSSNVQESIQRIVAFPEAFHLLSKRTRRCLVTKFPYGIIYQHRKTSNEVLVVAVAHLHRKPDYWVSRTQQT
ncbi:MAG: type II toxin-antitoxin system RelE/ParE family toxin [Pseudomonadales bacterium]